MRVARVELRDDPPLLDEAAEVYADRDDAAAHDGGDVGLLVRGEAARRLDEAREVTMMAGAIVTSTACGVATAAAAASFLFACARAAARSGAEAERGDEGERS